jgi:hypothetical protein
MFNDIGRNMTFHNIAVHPRSIGTKQFIAKRYETTETNLHNVISARCLGARFRNAQGEKLAAIQANIVANGCSIPVDFRKKDFYSTLAKLPLYCRRGLWNITENPPKAGNRHRSVTILSQKSL